VEQLDRSPVPADLQLELGESIDRDRIGTDERTHVADHAIRVALLQQPADPRTQARDVRARDRTVDHQPDRLHCGSFTGP